MAEGDLLWQPSPEWIEASQMARFMHERGFKTYADVWQWSVDDLEGFWGALWEWFDLPGGYDKVLGSREMPGAEWFPGAELNYAEELFKRAQPGAPAIIHKSERRELSEWSWDELRDQTARIAAELRRLGVGRGDRVVAYLPNIPETVAAFLATASIGAIWSSAAPEFGAPTVIDRFSQIEPKVLFAIDGYRYNGKDFDRSDQVRQLQEAMPSLEHTIELPYLSGGTWDFEPSESLEFERVPFDHPLWVLFSSGTTGLPKAIVQGQGGILIEHLKKANLHSNLTPDDRFFWFTTTGWMMWNFLVGGLLAGSTIVLFDGFPDPQGLWDLAAETEITCFGIGAAFITSCMKAGVEPPDLPHLKSIGSTGSPLPPEGFKWIYDQVKDDVWLFSTSGGTDLCTAFIGAVPILPVHEGELQAPALGAAVESWNEEGKPVVDEVGELVITEPMPSMPVFFWNDPDGSRYRESYFEMFPGVWRHGDWLKLTSRGTGVIYGRSDSTINRQGVRMGTAELYSAVEAVPEVLDSLVVDVEDHMTFFVVLDGQLTDELQAEIRRQVRSRCSPRHVPDEIVQIEEVPRTLSGKKLEVPVKKILMGGDPDKAASRDSLANPGALDPFVQMAGNR
jgi:acetoacetyl-CoA synthetase